MSLGEVHHQPRAQHLLNRALIGNRVSHAYIFHGPDGVGKELAACGLAETVLCPQPMDKQVSGEDAGSIGLDRVRIGCGRCEDCRGVTARTHPDLHFVYRQLNRDHPDKVIRNRKALDIGVDVLRHFVIARVGYSAARGRAKVFIVREADRMTPAAQNALLKTLEEPPGHTVLILLVNGIDRLLATTRSRCQAVPFNALPRAFVQTRLAQLCPDLADEQIDWYARISDGSLGAAVAGATDGLYKLNERVADGLANLHLGRPDTMVAAWTEVSKSLGDVYRKRDPEITDTEATRRGVKTILRLAATWYADCLRTSSGDAEGVVNVNSRDALVDATHRYDGQQAASAIERIVQAEGHLDRNVNAQLCMETLVNDLAAIGRGRSVPSVGA